MEYSESKRFKLIRKDDDWVSDDLHIRVSEGRANVFSLFDEGEEVFGPFKAEDKEKLNNYSKGYASAKEKYTEDR